MTYASDKTDDVFSPGVDSTGDASREGTYDSALPF